jgi:enamine deaminase RidA (YjgF/YER057c/UK114 family)
MHQAGINRIRPNARYSKATVWAGVGYISVVYPNDESKSVEDQTKAVLSTLDMYMEEIGTERSKLLKATLFLADVKDFDRINVLWDEWVTPGSTPARTPVIGPLLTPGAKVAIEATVAVG